MKFRYCASVIENSSLWKFFILKILRKSCVSLGNSLLWKFFALKNLRFENSSEKLCFFRKFFTLILLIYQILIQSISTRYRVSAWNSSFSEEFFIFWRILQKIIHWSLIWGIRSWYRVSDADTEYQHLIQSISTKFFIFRRILRKMKKCKSPF